jgi:hypothetical protein
MNAKQIMAKHGFNHDGSPKVQPRRPQWFKPRLNLVCVNGLVVGTAVVIVSPKDPNWYRHRNVEGFDGEITVAPPFNRGGM